MTLLTKTNLLRLLMALVFLLVLVNFMGLRTIKTTALTRLSFHQLYNGSRRASSRLPISPLALSKERHNAEQNSTVIPTYTTSMPQDYLLPTYVNSKKTLLLHTEKPQPKDAATANRARNHTTNTNLPKCSMLDLTTRGPITPNTTVITLEAAEAELAPLLQPGGAFQPHNCSAKDHVAIIVPFRNRYAHLAIFLRNIHPFLMKQQIAYRVFVIEQNAGRQFNRAAMLNIGYLEALKLYKWDCFIFHDVDLLPLDERNLYNCPHQPRHMSVAIDILNYKLPYRTIYGGVSAMTRQQFQAVNGFSNSFYGWGGEDDDMSNRLNHANFFISRYPVNIGRYTMLKHQKAKANPKRYEYLLTGLTKIETDGINTLKYFKLDFREHAAFTWYLVDLNDTRAEQFTNH